MADDNKSAWGTPEQIRAVQAQSIKEYNEQMQKQIAAENERFAKARMAKGKPLPIPVQMESTGNPQNDNEAAVKAVRAIVNKFEVYVNELKKSNQNFLLKAGKIILADVRSSFLSGMADAQETENKTGSGKSVFVGMEKMLMNVNKNLDKMISAQRENNKLVKSGNEEDKKENRRKKKAHDDEEEDHRESLLKKTKNFFYNNEHGEKHGLIGKTIGAVGEKFALIAELAEGALPLLLGGISLFFVDFDKLGKNPVWEKLSKLITEKIIPAVTWLFKNVFGPLADFLVNTTLPNLIDGMINSINDLSDLVQDVMKAFNSDSIAEGITSIMDSFGTYTVKLFHDLFDSVVKMFGGEPEEVKKKLDYELGNMLNSIGETLSNLWKDLTVAFAGVGDVFEGLSKNSGKQILEGLNKIVNGLALAVEDAILGLVNLGVNFFLDAFHWKAPDDKPFDITRFMNGLIDDIVKWFDDGLAYTKEQLANIGPFFSNIYDKTINLVTTITSSLVGKIDEARDTVVGWFQKAGSFAADLLDKAIEGMGAMKDAIIGAVANAMGLAKNSLTALVGEGSDLVKSLKDKILNGFWGLVDSLADATVSALSDVAKMISGIPETIKNHLMDLVRSLASKIPFHDKIFGNVFGTEEPKVPAPAPEPNARITEAARLANMAEPVGKSKPTVGLFKQGRDKDIKELKAGNVAVQKVYNINNSSSQSASQQVFSAPTPYNSRPAFGGSH